MCAVEPQSEGDCCQRDRVIGEPKAFGWVVGIYFGVSLFLSSAPVFALSGELRLDKGFAQVLRKNQPIFLSKLGSTADLQAGDQLHTNEAGRVQFGFGTCKGQLDPEGYLELRPTATGVNYWLSRGTLVLHCTEKTQVQTLEAVSQFKGSIEIKALKHRSLLSLLRGQASIANLVYPGERLTLSAGERAEVSQLNRPIRLGRTEQKIDAEDNTK